MTKEGESAESSQNGPHNRDPESRSAPEANSPAASTLSSSLKPMFSWFPTAIRTPRTLKTLTRCLLVTAATIILLVDSRTLLSMGQAGFFAAILSILLPPSLALSLFLLAGTTLGVGMLLGWAWGVATMAAGLSVQDKGLLASRIRALQSAGGNAASANPAAQAAQMQTLAFHGYFLDPRVSAVYGAMFFIGTFFLGALRARAPKLTLLAIFGTIVMDVMSTFGPLLPTAQYTIAKMFLIPSAYYMAIAIASLILIFPESLNHVWLTSLDRAFFGPVEQILMLQSEALEAHPSDHKKWAQLSNKSVGTRTGLIAGITGIMSQVGLLDLEISLGRLGPGDLKKLAPEIRGLGMRSSGLLAFQVTVLRINEDDNKMEEESRASRIHGWAQRKRMIRDREERHGHTLDTLVPILAEVSSSLRLASSSGVAAVKSWFIGCNTRRWTSLLFRRDQKDIEAQHAELVKARDELRVALVDWRAHERVRLVKPFERFFDEKTGKLRDDIGRNLEDPEMFTVRSLFVCFVFCDAMDAFATRLLRLLERVTDLDGKRTRSRFWLPSGFGKLWRMAFDQSDPAGAQATQTPLAMGTATDPTEFASGSGSSDGGASETVGEEDEVEPRPAARNPDALPPTTLAGKAGLRIVGALRFLRTAEGIFALRHAFISLALWIPAVVPSSAWFYYNQKGLWALIMAQMSLAPFAGDQLFGVATRLVGTLVGLVIGMVVWYIGAPGTQNGSPYAIVVVTAVFVSPFLLARIAAPPQHSLMWTMVGVTIVFVVGYSWIDGHLAVLSNLGIGVGIAWKRALLVIIGFTAGGLAMMFPRPTSSRILVRRTLAATLREMGSILGQEVEAALAEELRAQNGVYDKEVFDLAEHLDEDDEDKVSPKERRVRAVARRVLAVFERLQGLTPSLSTAQWEPQIQGLWPHKQYQQLHSDQLRISTSLALLAGAFSKLDTKWCRILVERTPFLNPNLLADVFSTIEILSHALDAGHPIPESLPLLRDRLLYHEALVRYMHPDRGNLQADVEESELVAGKVDGASIGFTELSLGVLMDEQLPTHSTAVVALGGILSLIDDIASTVRELCGETGVRGFETLEQRFRAMSREERNVGVRS
ncbi:unnamed protein product [Mycena citricolor]|uniref:ER transporter 6TM N-terminal domain-containing protein n=1 Tax=Mycena citricolor TaxID=2018698 RepID=A0AAD2H0C3_9AGAR|nr:unnamed protein product [Mycena citricolor]